MTDLEFQTPEQPAEKPRSAFIKWAQERQQAQRDEARASVRRIGGIGTRLLTTWQSGLPVAKKLEGSVAAGVGVAGEVTKVSTHAGVRGLLETLLPRPAGKTVGALFDGTIDGITAMVAVQKPDGTYELNRGAIPLLTNPETAAVAGVQAVFSGIGEAVDTAHTHSQVHLQTNPGSTFAQTVSDVADVYHTDAAQEVLDRLSKATAKVITKKLT